ATGTAIAGQYKNIGYVSGWAFEEVEVTDSDPSHYFGVSPEFVVKRGICESEEIEENGIILDKPYLEWDSNQWPAGATLNMRIFDKDMNLYDTLLDVENTGRMYWPGYDDSGFDPATGIGGIIYPPAELRPIYIQMYTNPETAVELVEYPPATEGCTPHPDIDVTKDVDPTSIEVGLATPVTWTITVTNTGDSLLQNVELTDALVPACDLSIGNLDAGESIEQTCTSTHTPDNLQWSFTNVAIATGIGLWGTEVTDQDDAVVDPFEVQGTAQAGDTVWLDNDKDGVQDADEPGLNGAKVVLKDADGTVIATLTTAKGAWDGFYKFLELDDGKYTIAIDMSSVDSSYELTTAGAFTITLADGDDYLDADFGLYAEEELPKTGVDSEGLTLFALGLLMLGSLAVLSTRKRRGEQR
ncbi:MAG: SdrD B-like domain-containing protein, partial [Actinomycetota bacterium]|nr:SdrD B-like domain-containing protein [Actinomycetota bacterium]